MIAFGRYIFGWILVTLLTGAACAQATQTDDWRDCPGTIAPGPAPPELPACVAASGSQAERSLRVGLGDDIASIRAASTFKPGRLDASRVFFTDDPVNVEWRTSERQFVFDNVGGTGEAVLLLNFHDEDRLSSLEFAWQNRPLTLSEVIGRARQLQQQLIEAGFARSARSETIYQEFVVIGDDYRPPTQHFADWSLAESALEDDGVNIDHMRLYTLCSADAAVVVTAKNMRRAALNFDRHGGIEGVPGWRRTVFDGNGGYEWLLTINIHHRDSIEC
jgi:hypothetical protein